MKDEAEIRVFEGLKPQGTEIRGGVHRGPLDGDRRDRTERRG